MKKFLKAICIVTVITGFVFSLSGCTVSDILGNKEKDDLIYSGTAEADEYNITSEIAGKIKELKVQEGQMVNAGDIIAFLDSTESALRLDQAQISLNNAQNELDRINEGNRKEDIKAQQAFVSQAEAAVVQGQTVLEQAQNNAELAQTNYDYKVKLYNDAKTAFISGNGTQSEVDRAKNAVDNAKVALNNARLSVENAKAQLNSLKAQLEASKQKLNLLVNGATNNTKKAAQYGVDTASKNLELTKIALNKSNITSSASGVIETINFKPGEYVAPGNPIVTLLDTKNMYVKIYVPEKVLPILRLDKEVSMKSDFIKDKIIKGKITYISPEAEFTPMNIVTKKDRMKLVYAVKVKILDNIEEIKPGMLMYVNIQ